MLLRCLQGKNKLITSFSVMRKSTIDKLEDIHRKTIRTDEETEYNRKKTGNAYQKGSSRFFFLIQFFINNITVSQ